MMRVRALVGHVSGAAGRHGELQAGDGRELVVHAAHEAVHLDLQQPQNTQNVSYAEMLPMHQRMLL